MNDHPSHKESQSKIEEMNLEEQKDDLANGQTKNHDIKFEKIQELTEEARTFNKHLASFKDEFLDSKMEYAYLLSKKWLSEWEKYVDYENIIAGKEPDFTHFGKNRPGMINDDIIQKNIRLLLNFTEPHPTNVLLKPDLVEGVDYINVSSDAIEWAVQRYGGKIIKRPILTSEDGSRKVEVYLKKFNMVVIDLNFLKDIDGNKECKFNPMIFQISSKDTVKDFINDVFNSRSVKGKLSLMPDKNRLRFWKLDSMLSLTDCFTKFQTIVSASSSYDYQIPFPGIFLNPEPDTKIEDLDITEQDYIFLEVRLDGKAFTLVGDNVPLVVRCEGCLKYLEITSSCACNKAHYCSVFCQERDRSYHEKKCEKAIEAQEKKDKSLIRESESKLGMVGLSNLGNTCFMNSGLQCMVNVPELAKYFLSNIYLGEINKENPLGTKGNLVNKYASLVKNIWFGTSPVFSPSSFKNALGEFATIFNGYQQHDSQEFLAYLIDGMHEDLNRVKQKKIVEQIEDETKTDEELAQLSWQNHLKRNQSIMVDLFQGQFKSTITCPECNRVSVTFDPFNTLSLPIPITTEKIIEIYVVFANYRRKGIKLKIKYKKLEHKIDDLKQDIKKMLDGDLSENIEFVKHFSHTSRDFITLDSMVYTNELRKKSKRHVLFCLEIPEEDIRIPDENKRAVGVYFYLEANPKSEGTSFWSRKPQTYLREIIISLQGTTKDLYLRVFKYIKFLYQDILNAEDWQILSQMNDQDAFVEFYDKREMRIFKLKLISNAKYYGECIYCGMRECKNCVVDYDNPKSLSELYEKAKQEKHDFEIEVVMLNEKFPNLKPAELNTYIDFETKNIVEKKDETTYSYRSSEKPKITRNIDECFRQFSVPEQLCQDNMWYCNKCKKHQEALKKMEIYKAPPILIIHLKRFRSEGRSAYGFISSRSKISDIISFPTNGRGILDLSPYVLSKGFPSEYPLERIVPNHELPFLDPLENIPKTELKLEKPRDNDDWASGWKENSLFKTPTEDLILTVHDDILDNMLNNNPDNLTIEEPKEELKKEKSKTEETKTEPKSDKHMQNGEKIIEENRNGVEINDPNSMEYELMSIVNHYGSMGGGHYTAYVKNHLYQVWREFDDSKIKPISEDAICSEAAYVLFYRKKNLNFKL